MSWASKLSLSISHTGVRDDFENLCWNILKVLLNLKEHTAVLNEFAFFDLAQISFQFNRKYICFYRCLNQSNKLQFKMNCHRYSIGKGAWVQIAIECHWFESHHEFLKETFTSLLKVQFWCTVIISAQRVVVAVIVHLLPPEAPEFWFLVGWWSILMVLKFSAEVVMHPANQAKPFTYQ